MSRVRQIMLPAFAGLSVVATAAAARPVAGMYTQNEPRVALSVAKDRHHVLTFSGSTRRCLRPLYVAEVRAPISASGSFAFQRSGRSFGRAWIVSVHGTFTTPRIVSGTFRFKSSSCDTGLVRFRARRG